MLYTRIEGAGLYKCAAVQFNLRGVGVSYRGGVRRGGAGSVGGGGGVCVSRGYAPDVTVEQRLWRGFVFEEDV